MTDIIESLEKTVKPKSEKKTATITYRVSPTVKERLKHLAESKKLSMNGLMTEALIAYLKTSQATH